MNRLNNVVIKLWLTIILIVTTVLILLSAALITFIQSYFTQETEDSLLKDAQRISQLVESADDKTTAIEYSRKLIENPDGLIIMNDKHMVSQHKDKIKDNVTDKVEDILQNARTTIAIHQLKLKKLAFTDGIVRQKKKLYDYTLFDNNGEQYTIQKASNFGFKKGKTGQVVTSKGISQLDYFRETNIYSKVAKVGISALEALSFLDLAKFISGNGEQGQIPSPIPALDFVISLMLADTKEHIDNMVSEVVDNTLETTKNLGIKGVDEFLRVGGSDLNLSTAKIKDVGLKKYETIDVSQETLENLLTGKLRKEKQLRDSTKKTEKLDSDNYRKAGDQVFKSSLKYKILLDIEYDNRISDYIYIVNSIFIK